MIPTTDNGSDFSKTAHTQVSGREAVGRDVAQGGRPLISVVMPVFNGEKYLAEAISSILGQTWGNIELIVVNDCSTDATSAIARSFDDDRIRSTINIVQRKLVRDGLVYRSLPSKTGEPEAAFVACSFWLVQNLVGTGRRTEGEELFEKLLSLRNDVGLLAEEYDPQQDRFMGNFPQALSHIALINAARMLGPR